MTVTLTFAIGLMLCSHFVNATVRTYNLTLHSASHAPDGFKREVYMINGQQAGPLIEANQGDTLEVTVYNNLDVPNTIHWHGLLQRGTPDMDGVPGVTQSPIPPGGNFTYRMPLGDQAGFYWYHSHFKTYYNDAVRGPLLIHPDPSLRRPFESLARNENERRAMLQAERDAMPVLLADWYHNLSSAVFQEYMQTGAYPNCVDSLLANGQGRVQCLPSNVLMAGTGLGIGSTSSAMATSQTGPVMTMESPSSTMSMDMGTSSMQSDMASAISMASMTMEDHSMGSTTMAARSANAQSASDGMSSMSMGVGTQSMDMGFSSGGTSDNMTDSMALNAKGCMPPMQFDPGYSINDLAPATCSNTTAPLLTIPANASQGWLSLHLVNAAATSNLRVSIDAHTMWVYAADGDYVKMQEVKVLPMAIGERYSVMIKLDQMPGQYYLRFAAHPAGDDMQQVIEDQAIIEYQGSHMGSAMRDTQDMTWMLTNGSAKSEASVLDLTKLAPFVPKPPPNGAANVTKIFSVNQTAPTEWIIDTAPYVEASTPVVYGNVSDGWNANTTIHMPANATVDIVMQIANGSMDTMGHPMHLHGHKFWVLGTGSGQFPYASIQDASASAINMHNPPYRDTVTLPASGWAVIRYITDNPGAWLFHCHIQWHLVSGMALVLVEDEAQLSELMSTRANTTIQPNASTSSGSSQQTGVATNIGGKASVTSMISLLSAALIVLISML